MGERQRSLLTLARQRAVIHAETSADRQAALKLNQHRLLARGVKASEFTITTQGKEVHDNGQD